MIKFNARALVTGIASKLLLHWVTGDKTLTLVDENNVSSKIVRVFKGKTAAPGVGDDSADGYIIGDIWIDETNDVIYQATDVTVGAAVWKDLSAAAGGLADGDKGDVTVSGSGLVWTIDNGVVTLAKMANMATASLIYRKTAGAGAPEVNTLATLKTDLALVKGDVGLGNVDNTSDLNKPVSTAQQAAIDAAVVGLLDYKGGTDASTNPNYPSALKGDAYSVTVAGKVGGASGKAVEAGDVYVATADNAGGTEAAVGTSWIVLEHNLAGALLSANNLSDLTNVATARTNLGAGSASGLATLNASSLVVEDPANATATPAASKIVKADGSGKIDGWVSAMSETVPGKAEAATVAETNTGTDAGRAVTPDALAGSYAGTKNVALVGAPSDTTPTVGDGKAHVVIPEEMNGMNIVDVVGAVTAVSTSGTPTMAVRRLRGGSAVDVFSTNVTIDANEQSSETAATPPVINGANDDLQTGDILMLDIDTVGTGAKGHGVTLSCRKP